MDRLKQFGIWILLVIALYIFSSFMIHCCLYPEEVGGKIYNMTHKEVVNEVNE